MSFKVAIVGAGLAGVSTAYHLLREKACCVTLFDAKGIHGGASGASTGLMHPYPGEEMRRSWQADQAMSEALALFDAASVSYARGILRIARNREEAQELLDRKREFGDIEQIDEETFLIQSGYTIDVPLYLQKLWQLCEVKGAKLIVQKIKMLEELKQFDQIIIAAGSGIPLFPECQSLRVGFVKGQALLCSAPASFPPLAKTLLSKGHVTYSPSTQTFLLGSTYERGVISEEPCVKTAEELLIPLIAQFFPEVKQLNVIGCRAGIRVTRVGHYLPIVKKLSEKTWVITGLGSRGLLYHAYVARKLVGAIAFNLPIPAELCQN